MFIEINSAEEFIKLRKEQAILFYFSTVTCNVCKVLKPKVAILVQQRFPKIKTIYIDSEKFPGIAAQNQVFTAPTILIFFNGREYIRKSRNIGTEQLRNEINRLYFMLFP